MTFRIRGLASRSRSPRARLSNLGMIPSVLCFLFLPGTVATGHKSNTESGGELGNHPSGQTDILHDRAGHDLCLELNIFMQRIKITICT